MYDEYEDIDDDYETDSEDTSRSVSKKDQIPYRTTIQKIVDRCLFLMDTRNIHRAVNSLRKSIYFNMPGLPFKDRIDEFKKKLHKTMIDFEDKLIQRYGKEGSIYYKPETYEELTRRDKRRFKIESYFKEYQEEWLTFLIGLLAEHEALLRAKGYVEKGYEVITQMKKLEEKTRYID